MYVAVRRYEGVRDSQKVAQLVEEDYVPIISEMPGFVAYYCVDAGDGVMVSTSVFEHKDAEEQSTFRAGEFVAQDLGHLAPNPPQVTAGEVVAYKGGVGERRSLRARCVIEPGFLTAPALAPTALIHPSAWKWNSANFSLTEF
jgi:hypothetical protein